MQNLLSKCNTKVCNQPAPVTFVGVLNACASVVALEEGKHAHEQIIERGWDSNAFLASSLVDMYVRTWRMLSECLTRCHLEMWSLGLP
jgi:hypothetical protein